MEAPEKIYFTQTENGTHYYTEGVPSERNHIEYTRTDAFIEKACEYLMEYEFNDSPTIADRRKRVEDFKKYMRR